MMWPRIVWAKVFGLFVDDGRFAGAILVWLAACWLGVTRLRLLHGIAFLVLTFGLVAILVESAIHRARRLRLQAVMDSDAGRC